MPLATTNVVEIIDRQVYLGQVCLNRYYYLQDNIATPDFNELANSFQSTVVNNVVVGQNPNVSHAEIIIRVINNLGVPEFRRSLTGVVGTNPGLGFPSYVALNFKLNRSDKDTRNGSKRFVGINEDDVDDNFLNGTGFSSWSPLELQLDDTITDLVNVFTPIIARIDFPTVGQITYSVVASSTLNTAMTTQRSRKV